MLVGFSDVGGEEAAKEVGVVSSFVAAAAFAAMRSSIIFRSGLPEDIIPAGLCSGTAANVRLGACRARGGADASCTVFNEFTERRKFVLDATLKGVTPLPTPDPSAVTIRDKIALGSTFVSGC